LDTKVTILTPTFNGAMFIPQMIESILMQNYQCWELLISDDGSTDNTPEVVLPFLENRIRYLRCEQNKDQLNALHRIVPCITGDIVMLLHSDDMLSDPDALARIVVQFSQNEMLEGIYADLLIVDSEGLLKRSWKAPEVLSEVTIMQAILSLGNNLVYDTFCVSKDAFLNHVLANYILWNTFYWMKLDGGRPSVLNLHKIDPYYKYRISDENYLSQPNEARHAFVLSGCFRTIMELSYYYGMRNAFIFNVLSGIPKVRRLVLWFARFFCSKHDDSLRGVMVSMKKNLLLFQKLTRIYNLYTPDLLRFFASPIELINSFEINKEVLDIKIDGIDEGKTLFGKDSRIFFEMILANQAIPYIYELLVKKAPLLKAVRVSSDNEIEAMRNILRFLCLPLPILVAEEVPSEDCLLEGFRRRFSWRELRGNTS